MISSINVLGEYLSPKDIAILNMTNKSINDILKYYHKLPKYVGYCKFCDNTTCWILHGSKTHCCTECVYKEKNNLFEQCHLIKNTLID